MSATTPKLALPYSIGADALGSVDDTMQALATDLDNLLGSAYVAYTPTLTNLTLGNGTRTGAYRKVGRSVKGYAKFTLGSTSAVTGNPSIGLPVAAASVLSYTSLQAQLLDSGTANYDAIVVLSSVNAIGVWYRGGANGTFSGITSTLPFTWAVNDNIEVHFEYESAA